MLTTCFGHMNWHRAWSYLTCDMWSGRFYLRWTTLIWINYHLTQSQFKLSIKCYCCYVRCIPWFQGSWGQHGAQLGLTGPRWAPCWPRELCYLGCTWSNNILTSVNINIAIPPLELMLSNCIKHAVCWNDIMLLISYFPHDIPMLPNTTTYIRVINGTLPTNIYRNDTDAKWVS